MNKFSVIFEFFFLLLIFMLKFMFKVEMNIKGLIFAILKFIKNEVICVFVFGHH
jgi:hypothetical protein